MPGFDGTGPQGRGPMTGRAMGYCILKQSQNEPLVDLTGLQGKQISHAAGLGIASMRTVSPYGWFGRRFGRGCGRGRGRNRFGF